MSDKTKIAAIQTILEVSVDGKWGPKTQAALEDTVENSVPEPPIDDDPIWHSTYASSFADPADIVAFNKAKSLGMTDEEAFKRGDNGIGCWSQSTVEGTGPSCALPPDYMEQRWGSINKAKNKLVKVAREHFGTQFEVVCVLKDRMPWIKNLHNQAHIDLNPDALSALGLEAPAMAQVVWCWAADLEDSTKT